MAHGPQEAIERQAIRSLYRGIFDHDPHRANNALAVAELALQEVRKTLEIADDDARVLKTALGWAAFDYSNQRAIVGPGYLAHAVRWRSANRRPDSETLGTDVMTDIITMRARGLYSGTNALQDHGAGWTFCMSYEDAVRASVFGLMEYSDYPLPPKN